MSKIQVIQPNYQQQKVSQNITNFASRQSFSGNASDEVELVKEVVTKVDSSFGPVGKIVKGISKFLDEYAGEKENQLINAVFTTSLAPLMIAFNPFSKSDEKTKKYTALRQPISAAIAISGGLAMTEGVNYFMNKMVSEGYLPFIDCRLEPDKEYLKSKFNKAYKEAPDKQAFLKACKPEGYEGVQELKGKYKKACIAGYVKTEQEKSKKLFTSLLGEKPENIHFDQVTKTISVVKADAKTGKQIIEEIGKNIPNLNTESKLKAFINKNNLYSRTLGDFMEEQFKFEFYHDGALKGQLKPSTIQGQLGEVKALDFLERLGLIGQKTKGAEKLIDEPELYKILSKIRQPQTEKGIEEALNKSALKPDGANILADTFNKQAARMDQMQAGGGTLGQKKITLEQLLHRLGYPKENVNELMNKNMSDALAEISQHLKIGGKGAFNLEAGLKDFAENILAKKISRLGKDAKNFKGYANIFFNLFMTMITCTVLNWAYPRFVEKFFPRLTKSDHGSSSTAVQKGGDK